MKEKFPNRCPSSVNCSTIKHANFLGLFYAFYDVNRSADTLASIFDGLGIAVGTTVAGLIVAISAMIFYATLKLRFVRLLNVLENETLALGNLIDVIHSR